jgi:hypothetical protein
MKTLRLVTDWLKTINCFQLAAIRFKKTIRQPFTIILICFNVAIIILSAALPFFTFVKSLELKMFLDISIASTFIIASIVTIYFASTSISEEIEDRTIFAIFSKPVGKNSYLFGNFLGLAMVSFALYTFSYFLADFLYNFNHFNLFYTQSGKIGLTEFIVVYFSDIFGVAQNLVSDTYVLREKFVGLENLSLSFSGAVFSFFGVSLFNSLFMISVSVALSPFVPFGLNLVICLCVFSLGSMEPYIAGSGEIIANSLYLSDILYCLLPRMDLFNSSDPITLGLRYDLLFLLQLLLYSILYSCFIIFISSKFLERKEFV